MCTQWNKVPPCANKPRESKYATGDIPFLSRHSSTSFFVSEQCADTGAWYFSAKAARASMICRPVVYSAWKPILWLICRVTSSFRRRKSFSTPSTVPLKLLMLSQNT